ncbi:L-histidine N(alpha)-methyltransferase [Croceicoccus naphthovorans]|uniref:Methyltransferase n=1 Tax=Croceicoccus naphthovorans TaxID=1348774 RepID=A0A0G3XIR3_9SPHN|nr:L-histidine N(alpha)-methyltransferase [Croceicoccus naphthovorans]AKM10509.1 methyltransferase [Croceicoccus naphthovorans]MBB3988698.1 dimethylhistidine N-methyltransferase [Croceicoccus naphthovorans]
MPVTEAVRIVDEDDSGIDRAFRRDVLQGLSQRQKAVPARWFYDERGSQLFEDITGLDEYYPTRAETEILRDNAAAFADAIGPGSAVVEFGSGSSAKTPLLLAAIAPAAYVPIDISGEFLRASADQLSAKFPGLPVCPVEADFMRKVTMPDAIAGTPRLGFFPGSTIGNMVPRSAVDMLREMRETLCDKTDAPAKLLIGMDRVKETAVLEAAYDDARGVTADFNLNLLYRINRELDGTVPVESFAHRAIWNDEIARIEMHLEAERDVAFTVCDQRFVMKKGETIHTENSHKYTKRSANALLLAGGWTPIRHWRDAQDRFMLILAEASELRMAP